MLQYVSFHKNVVTRFHLVNLSHLYFCCALYNTDCFKADVVSQKCYARCSFFIKVTHIQELKKGCMKLE